jgi:uncharacterized protein YjbJ (UPF0337 family)
LRLSANPHSKHKAALTRPGTAATHNGYTLTKHARSDTMNKDQVVGKIKDLAGEAQAGVGKAINSPSQVAKGKALEAEGEIQKKAGDVKEALKDAADAAKKRL